jgi:hypothetical protein
MFAVVVGNTADAVVAVNVDTIDFGIAKCLLLPVTPVVDESTTTVMDNINKRKRCNRF